MMKSRLWCKFVYFVSGCAISSLFVLYYTSDPNGTSLMLSQSIIRSKHKANVLDLVSSSLIHKEIPLVIVEEHHEVIPYWFRAADNGLVRKAGNILIHIDGHEDLGTPYLYRGFPFFRWPQNRSDLYFMMQRNDVFIQTAIIAGLFNKVIWMYPSYLPDLPDHVLYESTIGWLIKDGRREICYCEKDIYKVEKRQEECTYTEFDEGNFKLHDVLPSNCKAIRRFQVEIMNENLGNELSFREGQSVILDIDEDFYGTVYASQPLIDAQLNPTILHSIDRIVSELFCPKDISSSHDLDELLSTVIDRMLDPISCRRLYFVCSKDVRIAEGKQIFKHKMHTWLNSTCQTSFVDAGKNLDSLLEHLSKISSKQLEALRKVGFCWNTTPKSYQPTNPTKFGICGGAVMPGDNLVHIHTTSPAEIKNRTANVKNILNTLKPYPPSLITVCRSIRDGYTPRKYSKLIEKEILDTMETCFRNLHVHYDSDLQGGKSGWRYEDLSNFDPY